MALTDYYDKQGPSAVMPSWYPSATPSPDAGNGVFGPASLKTHDDVDLPGPAQTAPPAPPSQPSQPVGVVNYAEKMKGAESRANALNAQTDAAQKAMTAAQQQQVTAYDAVPYRAKGFYEEMFKQLNPYTPKTAAEIQRDLRRERNNKMIAAIGDGISALANLWGTSQGALNAYDGKTMMSQRYAEMYDKLRAERKANDEKYMAQYMAAIGMDDTNANARRANEIAKGGAIAQNARLTYSDLLNAAARERARADQLGQQWQTQANADRAFDESKRQWQLDFDESVRHAKASEALQAQSVALQRRQLEHQLEQDKVRFTLSDQSTIDVNSSYLHGGQLDKMVKLIANDVKYDKQLAGKWNSKYAQLRQSGDAVTDPVTGRVVGYKNKPLTDADRLVLVQDFIEHSPSAQRHLRQLQSGGAQPASTPDSHKSDPYGAQNKGDGHKSNPYG